MKNKDYDFHDFHDFEITSPSIKKLVNNNLLNDLNKINKFELNIEYKIPILY